jgi:mannitol/fructose-specific phosphotransferase system IIA component (Ntr-type)
MKQQNPLKTNLSVRVSDCLNESCILIGLKGRDSIAVIKEMGSLLAVDMLIKNQDEMIAAITAREQLSPTAVGYGIAIPHARTDAVAELSCCLGISPDGVDFFTGESVQLVFLIAGPTSEPEQHVRLLAAISKLCTDKVFRKHLLESRTSSEAMQVILEKEKTRAASGLVPHL